MENGFNKFFKNSDQRPSYVAAKQSLYIAKYIEDLMSSKKITNTALAEKLNCSKPYITKILRGDANLTIETLAKISCALDCNLNINFVEKKYELEFTSIASRLTLVSSNSSYSHPTGKQNANYTSEIAA